MVFEADNALESSFKKTTRMDEELVIKSSKASAGLFRDKCDESGIINEVRVLRQTEGNAKSVGTRGEYHHLIALASLFRGKSCAYLT